MIRATRLSGRPVIDIQAAEKLGRIDKVIIDPEARRVAAFIVSRGGAFKGDRSEAVLPAAAVHAIGPDAVTVRYTTDASDEPARFDNLPRVSDIIGRKIVTHDGRLLGVVDDVLISGADGVIVGYEIADSNALGGLFGRRKRVGTYLRADADLRAGRDLIVAPDDALADWPGAEAQPPRAETVSRSEVSDAADRRSDWFRRDDRQPVAPPPTAVP